MNLHAFLHSFYRHSLKGWWVLIWALIACQDVSGGRTPSWGETGDVVVTGTSLELNELTAERLRQEIYPGLPQRETAFNVKQDSGNMGAKALRARCVVLVTKDAAGTRPRLEPGVNRYAAPQIFIEVKIPVNISKEQRDTLLAKLVNACHRAQRSLMGNFLKTHRQTSVEKQLSASFGLDMIIPQDMGATKTGENFLWVSNNTAQGMKNICIYRLPGIYTPNALVELHDSVMGVNVKGETDRNHFKVVPHSYTWQTLQLNNNKVTVLRGLWEMENDAMGGPFLLYAFSHKGTTWIVEGFVFAPEMRKRNLMLQIETCLNSVKIKTNGTKENTSGTKPSS